MARGDTMPTLCPDTVIAKGPEDRARSNSGQFTTAQPHIDDLLAKRRALDTELGFAIVMGQLEEARQLLEAHADPNSRNCEQRTPLHMAAAAGNGTAAVRLLLKHRAEVNVTDRFGHTPLYEAQRGCYGSVERLLQQNGAQPLLTGMAKANLWGMQRSEVELGPLLGETIKSQVFKAKWRDMDVVAKFAKMPICIPKDDGSMDNSTTQQGQKAETELQEQAEIVKSELLHEIQLLALLRHPDLVLFLGACVDEGFPVMFITEYMPGGDLEHHYMTRRKERGSLYVPNMTKLLRWACAVVRALCFLHNCKMPIVHRDLKPLNLLLNANLDLKVTDFGISKMFKKRPDAVVGRDNTTPPTPGSDASYRMTGGVGSWLYMAPEVVRHQLYNEKVDIFSFGLILYFMSSGKRPFHEIGNDPELVLQEYCRGREPRPQVRECPVSLRPVMLAAWHTDPEKRPSAHELTNQLAELTAGDSCCTAM